MPFGKCIPNSALTLPPKKPRSFAYYSDTAYSEVLTLYLKDVDLLYPESTFTNNEKEQAQITMYSTAQRTASIAIQTNVGRLILGYYSSDTKM
jgi:ribonuclease Z